MTRPIGVKGVLSPAVWCWIGWLGADAVFWVWWTMSGHTYLHRETSAACSPSMLLALVTAMPTGLYSCTSITVIRIIGYLVTASNANVAARPNSMDIWLWWTVFRMLCATRASSGLSPWSYSRLNQLLYAWYAKRLDTPAALISLAEVGSLRTTHPLPSTETVSAGGRSARPPRLGVHPIWWRWQGNTKKLI